MTIPIAKLARLTSIALLLSTATSMGQVSFDRPFAPAEHGFVHESERPFRDEVCLNGSWDFQAVPVPSSFVRMKWNPPVLSEPTESGWDPVKIKIPSPWNVNHFQSYPTLIPKAADYRYFPSYPKAWEEVEMAWMRKKFTVPKEWNGRDVRIHFEAVAGECEVRVNGKFLQRFFNLNLPFDVDVTDTVKLGAENEVLVGVRRDTMFFDEGPGGFRAVPSNTFWGWECAGIWQDVSLMAIPKTHLSDVYIEPLVDQDTLKIVATVEGADADGHEITWDVHRWIAPTAKDLLTRAEQVGKLDKKAALQFSGAKIAKIGAIETQQSVKGALELWSPEQPNLYGVIVELKRGGQVVDRKYARFGWRQYGFDKEKFTLNGKSLRLQADAIHFMGVVDMSRRQHFAYFQSLKDQNVNLARATVQIRPRSFYEVADEVGMMVLAETGIWANHAIHREEVWKSFQEECSGLVLRDRNYASIVGWSLANEFYASLAARRVPADIQADAGNRFAPIIKEVQQLDPTRPWVSFDGDAQLWPPGTYEAPVKIAHYGDLERYTWYHENFGKKGIPWGITESTDQYWWGPESYEATVGDRVYESVGARMEGVGAQIYDMLTNIQRPLNGFLTSIYNVTWYGLKPLPVGHRDVTQVPTEKEGVWFGPYVEGQFGVQPERMGPYSTQLNPGWDPALPLYDPWPSFFAQKAAVAPGGPLPFPKPTVQELPAEREVPVTAKEVALVEGPTPKLRQNLTFSGVQVSPAGTTAADFLVVDAATLDAAGLNAIAPEWKKTLENGGTIFVSAPKAETLAALNALLPAPLTLNARSSVSVIPNRKLPLLAGFPSKIGYFGAPHGGGTVIMTNGIEGPFVEKGTVWLQAPAVDWRQWGIHLPELQRTVAVYRGELEVQPSGAAVVEHAAGKGRVIVSTLSQGMETKKHSTLLRALFNRMGVAVQSSADRELGIFDENNLLLKALKVGPFFAETYEEALDTAFIKEGEIQPKIGAAEGELKWEITNNQGPTLGLVMDPTGERGPSASYISFWLYNPLPDEVVANPHGSGVTMNIGVDDGFKLWFNNTLQSEKPVGGIYDESLTLNQGWNHVLMKIANAGGASGTIIILKSNNAMLLAQLKTSIDTPSDLKKP